ncbi:MAG: dTDP-glucose 4,6-dehydratase [bacterium]
MRLLVSGGSGFIGSNFIHYVLRERPEWKILNYDLLTYAGNPANVAVLEGDPRYSFKQGDICDASALESSINEFGPDAIINFAAETHVDRSIHGGAAEFVRTNIIGVQTILELVRRLGLKKYVQVSTDEVYGALPLDSGSAFTEETKLSPNSPYAASKAGGDLLCRSYFKTYGVPVIVTHASNNYGPYQFPEKLIPFMVTRALHDEPLPLYGDGKYVRDWLHVDDHCSALLMVLEFGKAGETYNVGADAERPNIEIAKLILKFCGKPETLIAYVADRPGHDRRYAVSSEKINRELGWKPVFDNSRFEEGLEQTVEWYRTHGDWIKALVDKSKDVNPHIVLK